MLRTDRVRLRPLTVSDAPHLVDLHSNPGVSRWLGTYDEGTARARSERFEHQWQELGYGMFAVEIADQPFAGRCGFVFWPEMGEGGETEIGWVLDPRCWSQGFATEAARACLEWFWTTQTGIDRVTSIILPGNDASVAVAERLGMEFARDDLFRGQSVRVFAIDRAP